MPEAIVIHHHPHWADPWTHPQYYTGILGKRLVAYGIDVLVIVTIIVAAWLFLLVLGFLTLGIAWHFLVLPGLAVPLLYHSLLIGGPRSRTLGMSVMGIRVMSLPTMDAVGGGRPTLIQAIMQTVAFYGSVALTGSLILVVALFNRRRRAFHDWVAGTVTVNDIGR